MREIYFFATMWSQSDIFYRVAQSATHIGLAPISLLVLLRLVTIPPARA